MTIKKRLFFSYTRLIFLSFIAFGMAARIVMFLMSEIESFEFNREIMRNFRSSPNHDLIMARWILVIALFLILISMINGYLTHRMSKEITKPLETLGEGVRQVQANNLSYRIDYQNNDEFLPICEAFNEMAEKLEVSTTQREKDEKNRRELIAGISHDLRTPLTSIKGYLEGIETGVAATADMRKQYFYIVKNKASEMEHIIEQLFLFTKLDMDEFPLKMRPLDIYPALSYMTDDFISEYASRGLEIILQEMQKDIYVSADVLMLRNVIINIIENSVKYKIKEQGQIQISAEVENNFFSLRLKDDGPGVKADILPKLFDAFYRTDPSRSRPGSGLGLAISAKIIERMGGSIQGELPASGGLTIVIKLPLVNKPFS